MVINTNVHWEDIDSLGNVAHTHTAHALAGDNILSYHGGRDSNSRVRVI